MDLRTSVHITVKTCQDILRRAPRLRSEVGNILDPEPCLLHDFPLAGLLERLADLRKAGYEGIRRKACPILGAEHPVSVANADDNGRHDLRENHIPAGCAAERTLSIILFRRLSAAAAESILPVPGDQMMCRKSSIDPIHGSRPSVADRIHFQKFEVRRNRRIHVLRKEILLVVDREKICELSRVPDLRKVRKYDLTGIPITFYFCEDPVRTFDDDQALLVRLRLRIVVIIQLFGENLLYHGCSFPERIQDACETVRFQ